MTKRAVIRIDEKGKPFLEKGQMWLFRNNVKEVIGSPVDGDAVDIYCHDQYLATGFYSEISHIAVRILTHHKEEAIDRVFFQKRFALAWNYRRRTERNNLDNCRLIFGDGDGLGGLTVAWKVLSSVWLAEKPQISQSQSKPSRPFTASRLRIPHRRYLRSIPVERPTHRNSCF